MPPSRRLHAPPSSGPRQIRTDAAGQSPLLMIDVAWLLSAHGIPYAVIGAMAAAVHGVVRASLDADGPIPALLEVTDSFANRVDLLIGLRGMDPAALERVIEVTLSGFSLKVIGHEDFVAMEAHAGSPVDLADARAVIEAQPAGLDTPPVRRIAAGLGKEAVRRVESLPSEAR